MARPAAAAGPPGRAEPGHHDAPMLLRVHVMEARGLPAIYLNGSSDPYVRLQLGRRRPRATTVVKRSLTPVWDEEFGFLVGDVTEELVVSVLNEDRFFGAEFLGRVRLPLKAIMETDDLSLGTKWYQLQPRNGGKFRRKRRGTPIRFPSCHGIVKSMLRRVIVSKAIETESKEMRVGEWMLYMDYTS